MSIEFSERQPAPKRKPETADKTPPENGERETDPLQSIGREANTFNRHEKHSLLNNLANTLKEREKDLSPETRARIFNADGSINFAKVSQLYGLDQKKYNNYFTPDGKIRPIAEVPEENETEEIDRDSKKNNQIPERQPGAKGGQALFREWGLNRDMNTMQDQLTERIIAEIRKGNVPDACRNMKTITMTGADGTKISFQTSAGYLAIGSNEDNIRVPLSGTMAKRIADEFGWVLPTAAMAQTTDNAAEVNLAIGGQTNNKYDLQHMADLEYARRHSARADAQFKKIAREMGVTPQELSTRLTRGEKKNIFIGVSTTPPHNLLGIGGLKNPLDKKADIQPYHYPHGGAHADYSQDTAIYSQNITVYRPGQPPRTMHLYDALQDPEIAKTLNSTEGGQTFNARQAYLSQENARLARQSRSKKPASKRA